MSVPRHVKTKTATPPTPFPLLPTPLPRLKILQPTHTCLLAWQCLSQTSPWDFFIQFHALRSERGSCRSVAGSEQVVAVEELQGGLRSGSGPSVHVVAGSHTRYRQSPWPGHVCLA